MLLEYGFKVRFKHRGPVLWLPHADGNGETRGSHQSFTHDGLHLARTLDISDVCQTIC